MTAVDWWAPARTRALAELDTREERAIDRCVHGGTVADFSAEWQSIDHARAVVNRPGWIPPRPRRKMPSLATIADYWAGRDEFTGPPGPRCFGCGWQPDVDDWRQASGLLERAHLVDRCDGGLDGPQNIVPLCGACHALMPVFEAGQGRAAIEWVQAGGCVGEIRRAVDPAPAGSAPAAAPAAGRQLTTTAGTVSTPAATRAERAPKAGPAPAAASAAGVTAGTGSEHSVSRRRPAKGTDRAPAAS